jgi:hypothetical protein
MAMPEDMQIIVGLASAGLFVVGLMSKQKLLSYALAILTLLILLAGQVMFPTSTTQSSSNIPSAVPRAVKKPDTPSISSQQEIRSAAFLSLTTQTSACSSAARATVTKAASGKGPPKNALEDAGTAANTCRETAAVIGPYAGEAEKLVAQVAQSCLDAVTVRAEAMDHLAALLDGMSTLDDAERYKARQNEALLKEFSCQSTLQLLSPVDAINASKTDAPSKASTTLAEV